LQPSSDYLAPLVESDSDDSESEIDAIKKKLPKEQKKEESSDPQAESSAAIRYSHIESGLLTV